MPISPSGIHSEREKRRRLAEFLESIRGAERLYIVGDLFDFWFEYRRVVPSGFTDILYPLRELRLSGTGLTFIGGNHDYWIGDFAVNDLGMTVHRNEILIASQGRKILCAHGDLVMPGDVGYKILKSIIRNRVVIEVSRWIHPDIMDAIASGVATGSRRISKTPQKAQAEELAELSHRQFFSRGNDIFVMGHIHHPLLDSRDGREFLLVGDWIESFTYGKLRDGNLTLARFIDEDRC